MSLGKKDIAINISSKAQISNKDSKRLLLSFLKLIVTHSDNKKVKISKFGTFYKRKTPKRIGRNPKTKDEFLIPQKSKLYLKTSNRIKSFLN